MFAPAPMSKIMFEKYDRDKSGSIDLNEFRMLCYDLGHHLSDEEYIFAIKRLDKNGDGKIAYDEFVSWWKTDDRFKRLQLSPAQLGALQQATQYFQYFDKDRSGSVDRNEFASLHADLAKNGFKLKSVQECLADLDTDGNGTISFNEYVDWLVRIGSMSLDPASS